MRIVRSFIPSISAIETCLSLYVNALYISSDITKISFSITIFATFSRSSLPIIAPVGLFGYGRIKTFVLLVIAFLSSSGVNRKSFSSFKSIITGLPPAR